MSEHDPLDVFLEEAAPADPPADLVERILAAASDPELRRQAYWADVGDTARQALIASAAGLLLSAGLAWIAVDRTAETHTARPGPTPQAPVDGQAVEAPAETEAETVDPLQLAITSEPIETQLAGGFMLLGGER